MSLKLRLVEEKDMSLLYEWRFDERHYPYFYTFPNVSYDDYCAWMVKNNADPSQRNFVLEQDDVLVGTIALVNIVENKEAEIGRVLIPLGRCLDGRGFGKELLSQVIDYGFETLSLKRLYLEVIDDNERAIAFYKKKGFSFVKECAEPIYKDGMIQGRKVAEPSYITGHVYELKKS